MTNIIVLVKQVPDTNAKITVNNGRVDLSAVKMVMSPYDEFAVETALRHKEAVGGEVTALTVGGPATEKILKDASTEEDLWDAVLKAWDGDVDRVVENARLLWLRRYEGELWQPPDKR